MEKPWANQAVLQALAKVADECFKNSMPSANTRAEWEAAIDVWNKLLDDAIANANMMKDEYVKDAYYFHAIIARDMSDYFEAMKARKNAPFTPGDETGRSRT
jgi:hypothetical protein